MCSLIAEVLRAERLRKICSPEVDNTWELVELSQAKSAVPREGMDRLEVDIGLEDELVRERRVKRLDEGLETSLGVGCGTDYKDYNGRLASD